MWGADGHDEDLRQDQDLRDWCEGASVINAHVLDGVGGYRMSLSVPEQGVAVVLSAGDAGSSDCAAGARTVLHNDWLTEKVSHWRGEKP